VSRRTKHLSVDADVAEILDDIGQGQGSATSYVEDLVRTAEREWRAALELLRAAGWRPAELYAAFDALNGYELAGLVGPRPATWAAIELADAARLRGLAAKWDLEVGRWAELCRVVGEDAEQARALVRLAAEFWRFNPRVERLVRG